MLGSKTRRYAALRSVADRLIEDRKLTCQPEFLFPVVSSLGFMNEDMGKLLKEMVQYFKDNQPTTPRFDGLSVATLKGRFKKELKNSICFALLKGNALARTIKDSVASVSLPKLAGICKLGVCACVRVCVCVCVCGVVSV